MPVFDRTKVYKLADGSEFVTHEGAPMETDDKIETNEKPVELEPFDRWLLMWRAVGSFVARGR